MPVNVLIIDDSAVMRKILERSVRQARMQIGNVVEASDGVEALKRLGEAGDGIGLIFCDVNMPNMDGLEFLKQVKDADFRKVPVVMVTTEGTEAKVMQALSLGAAGYIRKPFTAEQMQEVLGRLFP